MKNTIVLAAASIALCVAPAAHSQEQGYFSSPEQYASANLEIAQKNYQGALNLGNRGLAQSAIAQIAMAGIMAPGRLTDEIRESVTELVSSGASATIRYEAYLTTMVLEHPSLFVNERDRTFEDADQLFAAIGNRLQQELIAGNEHPVH